MEREESRLAKIISGIERYDNFYSNFDKFLDFCLFPFIANPTEQERKHFEECRCKKAYVEALKLLGELSEGYHDSLGDMFMENISHGSNSQFFTPEHICEFMAKITDNVGEKIADPTCGSGRLLLKSLQNSREDNKVEPTLYGCDLDHRCVKMTLLNLCLNSARGDVEWGNSLSLTIYKTYHIDRVMVCGKWMSLVWQYSTQETDMAALNEERQKVIARLSSFGLIYERQVTQSVVEAEAVETSLPPIVEPECRVPVQLEFDF